MLHGIKQDSDEYLALKSASDFSVVHCGSIVQITPISEAAKSWIDENVQSEGWQWMGPALCVDARFTHALIDGMESDGGLTQ